MLADTAAILRACNVINASHDAVINCIEVKRIETPAGKRWRVAVIYDFGDGDISSNQHRIPLYSDKASAVEAADEVAAYIGKNLGFDFPIPVEIR